MKQRKKVLITVKTYPTLSKTYDELVCTAGFLEDGSWIRIYPLPFRKLEQYKRFKKYQWIEIDLRKRPGNEDFRPESYSPVGLDSMEMLDEISPDRGSWDRRRAICLKKGYYTNLSELIAKAKNPEHHTSLATFKPSRIDDLVISEAEREWPLDTLNAIQERQKQQSLFEDMRDEQMFRVVQKIPYRFYYHFYDDEGRDAKLMIEDWEINALYLNMLKKHGNEKTACEMVKVKYMKFIHETDLYLFLGTTLKFHRMNAPNPFVIIGLFHPKPVPPHQQTSLF